MNLHCDRIRGLSLCWAFCALGCDGTAIKTTITICDAGIEAGIEEEPANDDEGTPGSESNGPSACRDSECDEAPRCGDGELDEDEECDDGNLEAGDGCDGSCFEELEPCATSPGNVVSNAVFDESIEGWAGMNDGAVSGELDSRSARGPGSSGSLAVTLDLERDVDGPVTRASARAVQCVAIEGGKDYELSAYYLIDQATSESAAASVALLYFDYQDCGGETVARWNSPEGVHRGPSWGILTEAVAVPPKTRSAQLLLSVSKELDDEDAATILFDDLALLAPEDAALCSLYDALGQPAYDDGEPEPSGTPEPEPAPRPENDPEPGNAPEPVGAPEPDIPEPGNGPEPAPIEQPEPAPMQQPEPMEQPEPVPIEEPEAPPALSYAADIEPIFVQTCVNSCHQPSGLGGPGGLLPNSQLDLSMGAGYEALTGSVSLQLTSMSLVGESIEDSYLWLKLTGSPDAQGDPMPSGGANPLSSDDLDLVRAWIESGANP